MASAGVLAATEQRRLLPFAGTRCRTVRKSRCRRGPPGRRRSSTSARRPGPSRRRPTPLGRVAGSPPLARRRPPSRSSRRLGSCSGLPAPATWRRSGRRRTRTARRCRPRRCPATTAWSATLRSPRRIRCVPNRPPRERTRRAEGSGVAGRRPPVAGDHEQHKHGNGDRARHGVDVASPGRRRPSTLSCTHVLLPSPAPSRWDSGRGPSTCGIRGSGEDPADESARLRSWMRAERFWSPVAPGTSARTRFVRCAPPVARSWCSTRSNSAIRMPCSTLRSWRATSPTGRWWLGAP